ncbi:MAG: metal ABC transporter substrate-binding protein [Aquificaceae bacterium]|nr:metal ABC transporter substrate-binding protein [Aquificaceae bacterium]
MLAVAMVLLFFSLCFASVKDTILASTYPVYYPLKFMAEDRFSVDLLIKMQADPHHYELKPDDIRRLQKAKAFFYLGVEEWEKKVAKKLSGGNAYPLAEGLELLKFGRHADPHIWLSPKAYAKLVERLRDALIRFDPSGAEQYRKKSDLFLKKLAELDEEYRKSLSSCRQRTLATTHLSTTYLGRDYGLEVIGFRGLHAEEEPRPSEVKRIVENMKRAGVKTVFVEMGHDDKLARRLAKEVGAKVMVLNVSLFPEEQADDYFSLMRKNLKRLLEGLDCQRR